MGRKRDENDLNGKGKIGGEAAPKRRRGNNHLTEAKP